MNSNQKGALSLLSFDTNSKMRCIRLIDQEWYKFIHVRMSVMALKRDIFNRFHRMRPTKFFVLHLSATNLIWKLNLNLKKNQMSSTKLVVLFYFKDFYLCLNFVYFPFLFFLCRFLLFRFTFLSFVRSFSSFLYSFFPTFSSLFIFFSIVSFCFEHSFFHPNPFIFFSISSLIKL